MPCRTFDDEDYLAQAQEKVKFLEATLCALLKAIPTKALETTLANTDWKEAGVTSQQFMEWWRNHQQEDNDRREREAERKRIADLRRKAKSKLSKAELDALVNYVEPDEPSEPR